MKKAILITTAGLFIASLNLTVCAYWSNEEHSYELLDMNNYGISSWEELNEFCYERGGYLAVINSQEENDRLIRLVNDSGYHSAFFGYTDYYSEGHWIWERGESSYTNWRDGQPNDKVSGSHPEGEDFAQFYKDDSSGQWNDAPFKGNTAMFIVEYDYTYVVPANYISENDDWSDFYQESNTTQEEYSYDSTASVESLNNDIVKQDVLAHVNANYSEYDFHTIDVDVLDLSLSEDKTVTYAICDMYAESDVFSLYLQYEVTYIKGDYGWQLSYIESIADGYQILKSDKTEEDAIRTFKTECTIDHRTDNVNSVDDYTNFSLVERETDLEKGKDYFTLKGEYYHDQCGQIEELDVIILFYFHLSTGQWDSGYIIKNREHCPNKYSINLGGATNEPHRLAFTGPWP